MPPAAREAFRTGKVAMLIDRAERAATWSHGKPIGVAPLPGSDRVFEPIRKEWTPSSPPNAPSYLARWRRLAGRDQRPARRHAARGGARLRQVSGQPRELQSPPRRAGLSHAAGPHVPDGAGFARPELGPGRRLPALVGRGQPDLAGRASRAGPAHSRGRRLPERPLPRGAWPRPAARLPKRRLAASPRPGPSAPGPRAPSASSGIIVAASTAWPRSRSLRNPGNKRAQPWTTPKSRRRP